MRSATGQSAVVRPPLAVATGQVKLVFFRAGMTLFVVIGFSFLYLYGVKHYRLPIPTRILQVEAIYNYVMDEKMRQLFQRISIESNKEGREVFETIWDATDTIFLSRKEFMPVEMYGQMKYWHQPNLKKMSFRIQDGVREWSFDLVYSEAMWQFLAASKACTALNVSSFDSLGFRQTGLEMSEASPHTVLFVGDSFTEGLFVKDEETFVSQFGRFANAERSGQFRVVNGGVNGYSAMEECFVVEHYYEQFHYDTVFLFHYPNDLLEDVSVTSITSPERLKQVWETNDFYLGRIADFCHQHNIRFILVPIPPLEQLAAPESWPHYQGRLREFCRKNGILFLDPFYEFKKEGDEKIYLMWDPHLNPYGHKVLAAFLWRKTKKLFL